MFSSLPIILAQEGAPASGAGSFMITMILMIVIFYFLLIRPQRKRQRELNDQISAMKTGDRVVTIGGIHGLVSMIKDRTVVLKVADNTRIEFEKTGIASVLKKDKQKDKDSQKAGQEEEAEEVDADTAIRK